MEDQAFVPFPKLSRLSREMVVTEKIDGTNAQIVVGADGSVRAGSRTRWITPDQDNAGFARWVAENSDALRELGEGQHFGEWWGRGIQRNYGLAEKRFSLFNTSRWNSRYNQGEGFETTCAEVPVCHVVPVFLASMTFDTAAVDLALSCLEKVGSIAAPGFMKPEGVVVFHVSSGQLFKKTLDKNDSHKGT